MCLVRREKSKKIPVGYACQDSLGTCGTVGFRASPCPSKEVRKAKIKAVLQSEMEVQVPDQCVFEIVAKRLLSEPHYIVRMGKALL